MLNFDDNYWKMCDMENFIFMCNFCFRLEQIWLCKFNFNSYIQKAIKLELDFFINFLYTLDW